MGDVIDENLVRKLIAAQFPRWDGAPVGRWPSGGTVNAMFRLGDDLVVRLPLTESGAEDVVLERTWLPRIAPRLSTRIPESLGAGQPGEGYPWPWSVYRWLPGENPRPDGPSQLAEDLAEFVLAMRSIPLAGAPRAYRGGPLAALDTATRSAIESLRVTPEENVDCDAVLRLWENTLRAADSDDAQVWLHADLMPGNLLVDGERLSAVIDFGCMGAGDPACDLFPAWNLLSDEAREVFREALKVDEATWSRGRARTLSQALIALPYYRNTNPAMAGNARHVIRTVLREIT
ncbi:phosphotransferase [Amycolatopsis thailandensis]|uniref:Phosphotransferase n=1 Tax=Amycolatopsis thailandensis TaxID=589330 RepID=A0A229S3X1_9PSEU|nr:aminoglycoside phosphotransferase family protein [Amycolatopsis thailandensis]OXM53627.1 phosphotransferase [Amycolatopsis thailandensis]